MDKDRNVCGRWKAQGEEFNGVLMKGFCLEKGVADCGWWWPAIELGGGMGWWLGFSWRDERLAMIYDLSWVRFKAKWVRF